MDNILRIIKKNDTISFPFMSLKKKQTIQFFDFSRKSDTGLTYLHLYRMCSARTTLAWFSLYHTFLSAARSRGLQFSVYQAGQRCMVLSLLPTLAALDFLHLLQLYKQKLACYF